MVKIVHFETLGCKLNQLESEGALRAFADAGFAVSFKSLTAQDDADRNVVLCVINTCTVTAKAEQKARRLIRLALAKFPESAVLVTGCYAQMEKEAICALGDDEASLRFGAGGKEKEDEAAGKANRVCVLEGKKKSALADVPAFLWRTQSRGGRLAEELRAFFADEKYFLSSSGAIFKPFSLSTDSFAKHSRASIKIQDGCDNACSYCRIRLARGRSVSLSAEEVISRAREIENAGQKEIVITSVNIAQYCGSYNGGFIGLAELLDLLLRGTKSVSFRISSLYPEIVDERLAEIVSNKRVRPHFHISAQSGSDKILQAMRRPYRAQAIYRACALLKDVKKNPFLACDIIAGFPGETEEDFALTMKLLLECGFVFVHAFPFSARPGTAAYNMLPKVPNRLVTERIRRLEQYNVEHKTRYIESFIGKTLPAIIERIPRETHSKTKNAEDETTENGTESTDRGTAENEMAEVRSSVGAGASDSSLIRAVTENFLHCKIVLPQTTPRHKIHDGTENEMTEARKKTAESAGRETAENGTTENETPIASVHQGSEVCVRIIRALSKEESLGDTDALAELR